MTYKIIFNKQATKFARSFDEKTKQRVKSKFRKLVMNPFRYLEHYEGEKLFKFRIGSLRALIEVDKKDKVLFVRVLDNRKRVYKKK